MHALSEATIASEKIHCVALIPIQMPSDTIWPWLKNTMQVANQGSSFEQTWGPEPLMQIPSFKVIGFSVLRRFSNGFYHIWAWWPSWSCDPDPTHKLSFSDPIEAPHKIYNLVSNSTAVLKKLKVLTLRYQGQRPVNELDLLVFIKVNLADCVNQFWCHSL